MTTVVFSRLALGSVGSAVILLAVMMMFAGCTPSSLKPSPDNRVTKVDGEPFAVAVAQLPLGTQTVMASPFGADSVVMPEKEYLSGLGLSCRKVWVQSGGSTHRIAVCRDDSGWYTAEPVFEQVQR